jgi:hypothetical protein
LCGELISLGFNLVPWRRHAPCACTELRAIHSSLKSLIAKRWGGTNLSSDWNVWVPMLPPGKLFRPPLPRKPLGFVDLRLGHLCGDIVPQACLNRPIYLGLVCRPTKPSEVHSGNSSARHAALQISPRASVPLPVRRSDLLDELGRCRCFVATAPDHVGSTSSRLAHRATRSL